MVILGLGLYWISIRVILEITSGTGNEDEEEWFLLKSQNFRHGDLT